MFTYLILKKMKKIFILIMIHTCFCISKGNAQSLKRECIASTGSGSVTNGLVIQQTIGQCYDTKPSYSDKLTYTPGFQQPIFKIVNIGISSIEAKVFPNPASKQITIETTTMVKNVTLKVTDVSGKILYFKKFNELKNEVINCSEWANGTYLINLSNSESNLYSAKLIILN